MSEKKLSPYGSWQSPVTSDLIVRGTTPVVNVGLTNNNLYWTEARPAEAGRNTVFQQTNDGKVTELTPAPYNVRTRVHEYGGAPFIFAEDALFFSNFNDNFLYVRASDGSIHNVTSDSHHRYADGTYHPDHQQLYWVREDHTESAIFAETTIVVMNGDGSEERIVVSGNDFYSNPRISPDGSKLAYLTWNHPNMPWDETELWVATINEDGSLSDSIKIVGGMGESILQPVWSPDGTLYFISDRSNWWNIMCVDGSEVKAVCPLEAEFGSPSWIFGLSDYTFLTHTTILASYSQNGRRNLAKIEVNTGQLTPIETPFTSFNFISSNRESVAFIAASPSEFSAIYKTDHHFSDFTVVKKSSDLLVEKAFLSIPEAIEFPTENGKTAHAIFYRPNHPDFDAPTNERPPLLVHVHGGPTSATGSTLNLSTQYWTSRGFAVVDVNYGGSTGYGRDYRDRLKGNWGIVDVADSANAVRYLIEKGEIDGNRVAIAGGSAGGYTTLASLVFTDVYSAGASHFGLSELEIFAKETHKFESRYMDGLLGPYPEAKQTYYDRSPINFTDRLSCPVIFFQGLDDKIVPPNQAELMVNALKEKGLPVAYVAFEGEGHGFRMSQNIQRSLDGEFYFYSQVFGFEPADAIEPVPIDNLQVSEA